MQFVTCQSEIDKKRSSPFHTRRVGAAEYMVAIFTGVWAGWAFRGAVGLPSANVVVGR